GGHVLHDILVYRANIDFMVPFLRYGQERVQGNAWELIDVNSSASLSLQPIKWLAFSWIFSAIREAAIRPEFQLHNYLMIALTYANKTKGERLH
ncbi:MAG: hypothetical protein AAF320_07010, partial [Myxococcota bacterium]